MAIKAKETQFGLKAPQKGHKIQEENLITLEDPKIRGSIIETSSGKDGFVDFHGFPVLSGIELLDVNCKINWH